MTCPVHGPGCYGIPEECAWIERDIAERAARGECFQCGAVPPNLCPACSGDTATTTDGHRPSPTSDSKPVDPGEGRNA